MPTKLAWLTPLNHLFEFAELYRYWLELPYHNHLIIRSACQELSIWGESYAIDCFLMTSRQIIQVHWLCFEMRMLNRAVACTLCTAVYLLLVLTLDSCFLLVVTRFFKLPELDTWIFMGDIARRDKISPVRIDIDGHQLVLLVVPQNLRYIDLHMVGQNTR